MVEDGYEQYLEIINEMLDDERYDFAADTLTGILEWVREREFITDGQKRAVDNIRYSIRDPV